MAIPRFSLSWNKVSFGLLACAAALFAACAGGGNTGRALLPQAAFGIRAPQRHHAVRAHVYLKIPAGRRHKRRGRHPAYVSPGTMSISFAVQPGSPTSGSATPMPLQTFDVVTPSPCSTISASSSALQCQFTVKVMPGSDTFTVKTYPQPNASGTPLSEYSGTASIPTPDAFGNVSPLAFTLEGYIDHVVLKFPSSVIPADTQGQVGAIPVGIATSAPLTVIPYDAANYQILSQVNAAGTPIPYADPVTLSVTPSGKGMALSNDASSGSSVTISNPNDLPVTILYDGSFTASGGTVSSASSFSISASGSSLALRAPHRIRFRAPRTATPAPNVAGLDLAGNSIPGPILTTTLTSPEPSGLFSVPGSATTMGFMAISGNSQNSLLGTATSSGITASGITAVYGSKPFVDSLGNYWVWDTNNLRVDCFAPGSSYVTPSGTIPASNIYPAGGYINGWGQFTEDSNDNLWLSLYGAYSAAPGSWVTIGFIPLNATTCSAPPSPTVYLTGSGTDTIYLLSLAAIPATNSILATTDDYSLSPNVQSVITLATAAPTPSSSAVALAPSGQNPYALVAGSGSVYALNTNASGAPELDSVSSSGVFTPVATYASGMSNYIPYVSAVGASASGLLGASGNSYNTAQYYFLLMNPSDTNAATDAEALPMNDDCNGAAFDASDTAWTLCLNASNQLQLYHFIPTSTWTVFPSTTIPVTITSCCTPWTTSVDLGILEAFGSTAGPFTLTNYDSTVVSGVSSIGDRGIALTLTEQASGTYTTTMDVTDQNGRSVPITIDITANLSVGSPPYHPRARRGYPPFVHK